MRAFLLVVVCLEAASVYGAIPASSFKRKITTQSPETTTTIDTTVDTTTITPQEESASTVSIPIFLFSNRVRRAVPASSYVRTEEGHKVAIPGLEAETTTTSPDMDAAIGEVFGETQPAQENGTSSEASTQESTTTLKPYSETPKITASSTTEKPTTQKAPDSTSTPAVPSSSSEKSHQPGASFGFSVALPTLPPADKIKIPNPFGFLG